MPTPWEDSVRCEHCHDKAADDRRRFCEFCGRQLSVREENPVENATAALDDLIDASTASDPVVATAPSVEAPADSEFDVSNTARPSARCESCGGPAGDADLCDACQRAFHAVIEGRKPETSVDTEEDETEQDEFDEDEFDFPEPPPVQASPSSESTTGNGPFAAAAAAAAAAPPSAVTVSSPWAPSPNFSTPQMSGSSPQISGSIESAAVPNAQAQSTDVPDRPPIGFAPLPPPMPPAVAAAAAPAVAPAPEPPAPAPQAQAPTAPVRQPVAARELTRPMPRPRPVPPGGRPNPAPSSSGGRTRALFIAGALVVVALAVCVPLAQPWLASEEPAAAPSEEPPPQEPSAQEAVARHTPAPQRATPVVDEIEPDPVPPRSTRPRPARPEPKREAAPAPAPAIVAMNAAALPAPEPVAAPAPEPEPAAAPMGPFFETRQVNESPQVASRVEPQIPDEIQGPVNDVVIIRVLVSQTGHASLVNVLRRSRTGPALDDAVVAAVKQWMFSPARKRGEAVSCWYHVGVPIQRPS